MLSIDEGTKTEKGQLFPSFLVDGMLGSLAVKLRILGYDTEYDKNSADEKLLIDSLNKGRILVTSDRELYLHAKQRHTPAILIKAGSEEGRLVELCQKAGINNLDLSRISRCSACNSPLVFTGEKDRQSRSILKCTGCSKSYWKGSHWKKLDALFTKVNRSLAGEQTKNGGN